MVAITMTINGTQMIKDVFGNKAPAAIKKAIKEELQTTATEGLTDMQSDAPVDTGELQNSIGFDISGDSLTWYASAEHAAHQEYGTIHQSGTAFFEANAKQAQDQFVTRLDSKIKAYMPR